MLEVMFAQGALGYAQYFLHDNALLVEIPLAGATAVWIAVIVSYLGLFQRARFVDTPVVTTAAADVLPSCRAADAPT